MTSLINVPSYALAGWLITRVGSLRSLQLGTLANAVFYGTLGRASSGWHLYAAYIWLTITAFGSSTYSAQSAMAMVEAQRAGLGCVAYLHCGIVVVVPWLRRHNCVVCNATRQGELQAGLSSLNAISHVFAPLAVSWLYDVGQRLDGVGGGLFYCALMSDAGVVSSYYPAIFERRHIHTPCITMQWTRCVRATT